ncbi:MAG TPA: DUF5703 domain-containing protein, partial [Candidatus Hydrogenedentes bacterium]|nr:DUF5703 domain-containing protein [Candidatus Hydrogenedentota bacterium]
MATRTSLVGILAASALTLAALAASAGNSVLDEYDVTWDTPSADSSGSMPLGNGDIGINLWVEPSGEVVFYISKTDAWSENARLLKLGRVRIKLDPNPLANGTRFAQTLHLGQGEIAMAMGEMVIAVWVDARQPVIRIEANGEAASKMTVAFECWRVDARELKGEERNSAYGLMESPDPVMVHPDSIVAATDRIVWFHRNESSIWPLTLDIQGMGEWGQHGADPLLHRTFGGAITGDGFAPIDSKTLVSSEPREHHRVCVHALTKQTETEDAWLAELDAQVARVSGVDWAKAREEHDAWWQGFWNRSWIHAAGQLPGGPVAQNALPLRIGADSNGSNPFLGWINRVRIFDTAIDEADVNTLAQSQEVPTRPVCDWWLTHPREEDMGIFVNSADATLNARTMGKVGYAGADGAHLTGEGWVEAPESGILDLPNGFTITAWVKPERMPDGGGRIVDKCPAGKADGYMVDTYPGNSLRMVTDKLTLRSNTQLSPDEWSHVAASYNAATGEHRLYVNGKIVASQTPVSDAAVISQGYALQRFMAACAGQGAFPIKFNGSIFTVDAREPNRHFDADYRAWGGPYWFQNTRLIYWPMLASGDSEMMQPLFDMYLAALPFAKARTKTYFDHDGAFFPETMYFWGAYAIDNYGWDRKGKPVSQVDNTYIRWYWSGALELLALMLDRFAYTQDEDFARGALLPLAESILDFYDQHYDRNLRGQFYFTPAASLETWQNVTDPLPEIAGLQFVTQRLLDLPEGLATEEQQIQWARIRGSLPYLPMTGEGDEAVLAPAAEILEDARNSENPELYAIFPYRLFGVGKDDLDMARRTFAQRRVKGNNGWRQDDTQAAFLGLADEAATMVAGRFAQKHAGSRFPAFWGPNFDWIPDQDHGSNGLMALQTMLLQAEGKEIRLFPAWPKAWDVDFKLHAPYNTTIQGRYRAGKLEYLDVTPESRKTDL